MKLTNTLSALLLLTTPFLAHAQTTLPCISNCETTSPASSFCTGTETGAALDQCECRSFIAGTALINCVKTCPSDQISYFAADVPASCRGQLFPGVSVSSGAAAATTTSASETTLSGNASGNTKSTTSTTVSTGETSTSAGSTASQTGKASGNGAIKGIALDISTSTTFIGGILALVML